MLCQSRIAYVLIHAGILGDKRAAALGSEAVEALGRRFWKNEARGWIKSIDATGRVADGRIDSYDQAFGLLALAWAYRASPEHKFHDMAIRALEGLLGTARSRGISGFPEWRISGVGAAFRDAAGPRRQNPHMHLLEAFLAWAAIDPTGPWLVQAKAIVELARKRFIDPADGSLGEFFDEALAPAPNEAGARREPGHHFEWVWLLRRWHEASADKGAFKDAERLYRFACTSGRDSDGLAYDAIDAKGSLVEESKLLWPQTEMIKAHAAWYEWTALEESREAALRAIVRIRDNYLIPGEALWHNQLARDLSPLPLPTPSRVLYHLFLALVEAERVFGEAGISKHEGV